MRVSGFLLQRSLAGFPNSKKNNRKSKKTYYNASNGAQILVIRISILIISQYSNIQLTKTMT